MSTGVWTLEWKWHRSDWWRSSCRSRFHKNLWIQTIPLLQKIKKMKFIRMITTATTATTATNVKIQSTRPQRERWWRIRTRRHTSRFRTYVTRARSGNLLLRLRTQTKTSSLWSHYTKTCFLMTTRHVFWLIWHWKARKRGVWACTRSIRWFIPRVSVKNFCFGWSRDPGLLRLFCGFAASFSKWCRQCGGSFSLVSNCWPSSCTLLNFISSSRFIKSGFTIECRWTITLSGGSSPCWKGILPSNGSEFCKSDLAPHLLHICSTW